MAKQLDFKTVWKQLSEEVRDIYKIDEPIEPLNKKKEMIAMQLLIEEMESQNAPEEDLLDILRYMVVVVDAEKHNLDWLRAYQDCKIDDYIDKYVSNVGVR